MTEIRMQEVYDTLLRETRLDLVVVKNEKTYIGPLFFEQLESEVLKDVVDKINLSDDTAMHICLVCYALKEKHNMLASDDKTLLTMLHWQFINGLTKETVAQIYSYSTDTDYFIAHPKDLWYLSNWEELLSLLVFEVWKSDEVKTDCKITDAGTFERSFEATEWINNHEIYYPGWHLRVVKVKKYQHITEEKQ